MARASLAPTTSPVDRQRPPAWLNRGVRQPTTAQAAAVVDDSQCEAVEGDDLDPSRTAPLRRREARCAAGWQVWMHAPEMRERSLKGPSDWAGRTFSMVRLLSVSRQEFAG